MILENFGQVKIGDPIQLADGGQIQNITRRAFPDKSMNVFLKFIATNDHVEPLIKSFSYRAIRYANSLFVGYHHSILA